MKKRKIFFDPRKEEEWLNSMKGYKLIKVGFITYVFEESSKRYEYQVVYTGGKMEYLKLMNNLKSNVKEIKSRNNFTWLIKEKNSQSFYRRKEDDLEMKKLYVRKYSLFSKSFLLFGIAFLSLSISINILFIICSLILFLLSFLYQLCIKTVKKEIK